MTRMEIMCNHMAHEIKRTIIAWIDDPTLSDYTTSCEPILCQLRIGWIHFMLGRIHTTFTEHQKRHYQTLGIQRKPQSWTVQLISKLWTTILRPIWTIRNSHVHNPNGYSASLRLLSDVKKEAKELYMSTEVSSLHHSDQMLFTPTLETILSRTYHQIKAWCTSVEIAIQSAADSLRTNNDPQQPNLPFSLLTQAPQVPPAPSLPPPLPTAHNTPSLTPLERRLLRRRMKSSRSNTIITPPAQLPSTSQSLRQPTNPPLTRPRNIPGEPNHRINPRTLQSQSDVPPVDVVNSNPPVPHPPTQRQRGRPRQSKSAPPHTNPTPIIAPHPHTAVSEHPTDRPERRAVHEKRPSRSASLPRRTHQPVNIRGTLNYIWSHEEDKKKLLQGSWRPP